MYLMTMVSENIYNVVIELKPADRINALLGDSYFM